MNAGVVTDRESRGESTTASSRTVVAIAPIPFIVQNPYQRLLYDALAARGFRVEEVELKFRDLWRSRREPRVLHFHWPQNYYTWWRRPARLRHALSWAVKLPLFGARIAFARALGYTVVWTIHEVFPHERTATSIDRAGARVLARASALLLAHDPGTAARASAELGVAADRVEIVEHGSYVDVYPAGRRRDEVRAELDVPDDAVVFLCFGHVRAYKDVGTLLSAFGRVRDPGARLLVAGLPLDSAVAASVREAARLDGRIVPLLDFVPDEAVAELFGAADVAVLPRGDGGTSGALVLALSLGVPVVAASLPDYAALTGGEEAGWLFEPGDAGSLAEALLRASTSPDREQKATAARARADRLRWPDIAERAAELLRAAVDRSR